MKPIQVSQVNSYIKRILQTEPMLSNISVIGEVSNLKLHSAGNMYFSLKDEKSKLNCFLGSENLKYLNFKLEEGMKIVASGNIFVYEVLGNYSLNVKNIEQFGTGNLAIEFEKLKKKLEVEGLFNIANKKNLPDFPKNIAVITSASGAAIHDIIKSIKLINLYTNILVFPVMVTGAAAAADIAAAVDTINNDHKYVDIIIMGRGGGSMEELWAFNEEVVARSIFQSAIPIISAVGHETDFTIADFVADIRAATPTAAALIAAQDIFQLKLQLDDLTEKLKNNLNRKLTILDLKLKSRNIEQQQRVLLQKVSTKKEDAIRYKEKLKDLIKNKINYMNIEIENKRNLLLATSPETMFKRGYAAMLNAKGEFLNEKVKLKTSDELTLVQSKRIINCKILSVKPRGKQNEE